MTDQIQETEQIVQEEVAASEVQEQQQPEEQNIQEALTAEDSAIQVEQDVPKEEKNYRSLREARELEKERADRAERELENVLSYLNQQTQGATKNKKQNSLEEFGISPDDFVEGKQFGKLNHQVKRFQEDTQHRLQQYEEVLAETQLKAKYNDFDNVVTAENVRQFCKEYPELSLPIQQGNFFSRGNSAYKLIKKFLVTDNKYARQEQKIKTNMHKPKSSATISASKSNSPLTKVTDFVDGKPTAEYRKRLREEMDNAINNL